LQPDEGQLFIICPFCSSTVYLDKSRVVFHWYLNPTLDEAKARGALARWMAGNQTVKDLDKKAKLSGVSFEYFPFWYFKLRSAEGKEVIRLEPAAATSVSEIKTFKLPAGDLRKYDVSLGSQAHTPTVPLNSVINWMKERQPDETGFAETALVHIPLFTFKYHYNGGTYTAIVEAATGSVFANIYPAKAEAPYMLVGGLSAAVFLCLATFPIIGVIADDIDGLLGGLGICAGVGVIAAPVLFGLAVWVASKV
jgi:hypothetical protein